MKIGFTSTSFRQIKSIEKIVKIASYSSADCIEWGEDVHIKDIPTAKRAKKLCDNAGITICSYGSYYRVGSQKADEWRKICEISNALGAKSIRVWLGNRDSEKTDDTTYTRLVEEVKSMCSVANEYNLTVDCECHDNTYNNNTDAFLKIQRDAGCENFKTYFQSRYKRLEYDLDRIERTLPYVDSIHISYSEQVREQFPKLDTNYINLLLDKIISEGFDGNILVEFTWISNHTGMPASIKRDIAKLRAKVGKTK